MDKLKEWFEVAQRFHGEDFWDNVFTEQMRAFEPKEKYDQHHPKDHHEKKKENRRRDDPSVEFPPIDVFKSKKELLIVIEVPGFCKENLEVYIEEKQLIIQGTPDDLLEGDLTCIKSERHHREFTRVIGLPNGVDLESATSKMNNGLLWIRFQRKESHGLRVPID